MYNNSYYIYIYIYVGGCVCILYINVCVSVHILFTGIKEYEKKEKGKKNVEYCFYTFYNKV